MPTVLRIGPYRFFFYSGDRSEPPHIHIERGDSTAKFWLMSVRLETSGGLSRREIAEVQRLVEQNQRLLLESWHDYFGS